MSDPKQTEELSQGPSLTPEGRLEGRLRHVEPPVTPQPEAPLELAPRAPRAIEARVEQYRADLRARDRRGPALTLVGGLVALAAVGLLALLRFQPDLRRELPEGVRESTLLEALTRAPEAPPVIINSTPPGADIIIGGRTVGQTPWAGENRWTGETKVVLRLAGYRKWEGQLNGGKAETLDAHLKR